MRVGVEILSQRAVKPKAVNQPIQLIWIRVGQEPTALAVGAGGGSLDIFSLSFLFSFSLFLEDSPI